MWLDQPQALAAIETATTPQETVDESVVTCQFDTSDEFQELRWYKDGVLINGAASTDKAANTYTMPTKLRGETG